MTSIEYVMSPSLEVIPVYIPIFRFMYLCNRLAAPANEPDTSAENGTKNDRQWQGKRTMGRVGREMGWRKKRKLGAFSDELRR